LGGITYIPLEARGTVSVDLDGVLARYDGWKGDGVFNEPAPGAKEFLENLRREGYRVVILTTRATRDPSGVWAWLREHDLAEYVDEVTDRKIPFHVHVDDRAITFTGDFSDTFEQIKRFRPHWRKAQSGPVPL
jgi:ribonucleotide monophosphatase NagD (HAD superfamily)